MYEKLFDKLLKKLIKKKFVIKHFYQIVKIFILRMLICGVKNKKINNIFLVVAPHPDDEIFGLGGFLLQQKDTSKCFIAYLTDGEASNLDLEKEEVAKNRIELSENVCEKLNIPKENIFRLHLPDSKIPRINEMNFDSAVLMVTDLLQKIKPENIFVTHPSDIWPYDHVAAYEIVDMAVKNSNIKANLFGYWVWLWYQLPLKKVKNLNLKNTYRIAIENEKKQKNELIDIYMNKFAASGKPYSGVLPKAFLKAFEYPYEIVEKLN